MPKIAVYLESGRRKVFAGALEWPGWCRSGSNEDEALRSLLDNGRRYAKALGRNRSGFELPAGPSGFRIAERLEGNATTDFGAPAAVPRYDTKPISPGELSRLTKLLEACWSSFDATARAATGRALQTGPRGGGRGVEKMAAHVLEGDASYLTGLGGKFRSSEADLATESRRLRETFVQTLKARAAGEIPDIGPRGGVRWGPRFAIRRAAWHALDHAWEIEDRLLSPGDEA